MTILISGKRFALIFASIFMLGAIPLLISRPDAMAGSGLSAGFMSQLQVLWQLTIPGVIGLYASRLPPHELPAMPMSFLLLFTFSLMLGVEHTQYAVIPYFMFGCIMCFALTLSGLQSFQCVCGSLIAASAGFHLGYYHTGGLIDQSAPLYYIIGSILSLTMIFAIALTLGVAMQRDTSDQSKATPQPLP